MDQRDEQEFADYFAARRDAVRRTAYLICGDWHRADDLAQTAFVALHRPIDPELAADLTALLANRGTVASGPAGEVPEPCPAGSRAAAVPVTGGVLYVLLVPPVPPERVGAAAPDVATRDGARGYSVTLDGGRKLAVISMSGTPGQPAPLADEIPDLARELATAL